MPPFKFPTPAPRRGSSSEERNSPSPQDSHFTKRSVPQRDTQEKRPGGPGNKSRFPAKPPRQSDHKAPHRKPVEKRLVPPKDEAIMPPSELSEQEAFLQPGIKPVTELLLQEPTKIDAVFLRKGRKGKETDQIIDLCRENNVRFSLVDDTFLDRLWKGQHQGVIARLFSGGFTDIATMLETAADQPMPLILALDQVQDPGNAGALARTLYALGGAGLIVPKHNGVYLGAAAARVAAGALDKLAIAKVANLAQALDVAIDAGFTVYGAEMNTAESPVAMENSFSFTPRLPAVLVLGSEEAGLRPIIRKRCDSFISIPFAREFNSLNVAQAGAILISAFAAACNFSKRP